MAIKGGLFQKAGALKTTYENKQNEINRMGTTRYRLIEEQIDQKENSIVGIRITANTAYTSNGKTAIIPSGFTLSGIANEQSIDNGLVIYSIPEGVTVDWTDPETVRATYDQFVWIPVESINDMVMCKTHGATVSLNETTLECPTCGAATKLVGKLYVTGAGEGYNANFTRQAYTTTGFREPDLVIDSDNNTTYLGQMNTILGTQYAANVVEENKTIENGILNKYASRL